MTSHTKKPLDMGKVVAAKEAKVAFTKEVNVVAVDIGDISTELFDPKPTSESPQKAKTFVQVIMSDGSIKLREFNLPDHVPPATITQLQALAATIRAKAVAEILP